MTIDDYIHTLSTLDFSFPDSMILIILQLDLRVFLRQIDPTSFPLTVKKLEMDEHDIVGE